VNRALKLVNKGLLQTIAKLVSRRSTSLRQLGGNFEDDELKTRTRQKLMDAWVTRSTAIILLNKIINQLNK